MWEEVYARQSVSAHDILAGLARDACVIKQKNAKQIKDLAPTEQVLRVTDMLAQARASGHKRQTARSDLQPNARDPEFQKGKGPTERAADPLRSKIRGWVGKGFKG